MKREATNHTKMARFERRLDLKRYEAVGILELLWHLATKESPAGNIGKLSDEDISGSVGWEGDPTALVDALVEAGWLDRHENYRLVVHDWSQHCEDSVHAKLARSRTLFVDSAVPSLRKLNKIERESADSLIATGAFRAPDGRIMPHNAAEGRPTGANPSLPGPSLPGPSKPEDQAPTGALPPRPPLQFPDPNKNPIPDFFEERYARHPKKGHRGAAERNLGQIPSMADPAFREHFQQVHEAWCESEGWTWNGGARAPYLDEWILDKGYNYLPPARASPAPPQTKQQQIADRFDVL